MTLSATVIAHTPSAHGPTLGRSQVLDVPSRRADRAVAAVLQYFGIRPQTRSLLPALAPEAARTAPPIEAVPLSIDRDRERVLLVLTEAPAPQTLTQLVASGVKNPGQAIYELQLAGYRIDRLERGYRLTRDGEDAPQRRAALPHEDEAFDAPTDDDGRRCSSEEGLGLA